MDKVTHFSTSFSWLEFFFWPFSSLLVGSRPKGLHPLKSLCYGDYREKLFGSFNSIDTTVTIILYYTFSLLRNLLWNMYGLYSLNNFHQEGQPHCSANMHYLRYLGCRKYWFELLSYVQVIKSNLSNSPLTYINHVAGLCYSAKKVLLRYINRSLLRKTYSLTVCCSFLRGRLTRLLW